MSAIESELVSRKFQWECHLSNGTITRYHTLRGIISVQALSWSARKPTFNDLVGGAPAMAKISALRRGADTIDKLRA